MALPGTLFKPAKLKIPQETFVHSRLLVGKAAAQVCIGELQQTEKSDGS